MREFLKTVMAMGLRDSKQTWSPNLRMVRRTVHLPCEVPVGAEVETILDLLGLASTEMKKIGISWDVWDVGGIHVGTMINNVIHLGHCLRSKR